MLAVTSLGIGAAQAAIISVDLVQMGNNGHGNADITELAGVVEAGGWETADRDGARNDTNLSALRADDGGTLVTTSATMTIGAGFAGYFTGASGFNTGTALFNNDMMDSYVELGLDTGGTISFTNLNASVGAVYDVYVYMNRNFGNTGTKSVTVGGTTKFIQGEDDTGPFSEANYATQAAADANPTEGGNYILFSGVSTDNLDIVFGHVGPNGRAGINGVQIVGVPEPSSAALLGLGGLALIMRRRK
ncbi:hypothetical protein NT6N_05000 [Oceaniferula spumae]|uniref:Ice-binding protein C-terminal domain-containing protein n=1 Tax=Oceaniferula spumae TaxID=2979115 RepID=A0AAT9FHM6_9BACT